jgi:DNA-binding MarR family transcriptional regulator
MTPAPRDSIRDANAPQGDPAFDMGVNRALYLAQALSRASRLLRELIDDQSSIQGIGEAEFPLLWLFQRVGAETSCQNELARRLGISPAQVSALVERLRQAGWVVGQRSSVDRRRQIWRLTDRGTELVRHVAGGLSQRLGATFDGSSGVDAGSLIANLDRILGALETLASGSLVQASAAPNDAREEAA